MELTEDSIPRSQFRRGFGRDYETEIVSSRCSRSSRCALRRQKRRTQPTPTPSATSKKAKANGPKQVSSTILLPSTVFLRMILSAWLPMARSTARPKSLRTQRATRKVLFPTTLCKSMCVSSEMLPSRRGAKPGKDQMANAAAMFGPTPG